MGKKRGLSVVERAKIATLNEEGVLRKANIKKTDFGSFQDLYRSGRPKVTSQKDDHLMMRMVVRLPTCSNKNI